jgi:hypothetical protein
MNTQKGNVDQINNSQPVPVSTIAEGINELSKRATDAQEKSYLHEVVTTLANYIHRDLGSFDTQTFMEQCGVSEQWREKAA